jgi:RNA polymerase sigma-70 factor (ECF subfamily)
VRAAAGQYEIDSPEQLMKLLATMARHKLTKARRDQFRARRDARRVASGSAEDQNLKDGAASPSRQVLAKELLDEVHRRLTDEERCIVQWRTDGRDWASIAAELQGSPEALRKRFTRAVVRVD